MVHVLKTGPYATTDGLPPRRISPWHLNMEVQDRGEDLGNRVQRYRVRHDGLVGEFSVPIQIPTIEFLRTKDPHRMVAERIEAACEKLMGVTCLQ